MGWGSSQQIGRLRSLLTATLASQGRKQWPAMENAIANSSGCTSSGGKAVGTWAEPSLMAPGRGREVHTSSALATRQVPSASSSAPPATPLRSSTKASSGGRASWTRGLLLLPPALAALLGKWQLDRRQWKQDLLERRKRMLQVERAFMGYNILEFCILDGFAASFR